MSAGNPTERPEERRGEAYVDEFTLIQQLGLVEGETVEPASTPYMDGNGALVVPVIVRKLNP